MFLKTRIQGFQTAGFFKSYFILGILGLSLVFFLYSNWVTRRLERETSEFSRLLANFAARLPSITDKKTSDEARAIIDQLKIPFVITNANGDPIIARGVGDGLREKILAKTLTPEDKEKLLKIIKDMDKNYNPIRTKGIIAGEGRKILGYIYYDETKWALNQGSSFVITDIAEEPVFWHNIGDVTRGSGGVDVPRGKIQSFIENTKKKGHITTIQFDPFSEEAYFHYGRTSLILHLRWWMTLAQMTMVAVFLIIGFVGYQRIKYNEQQAIWSGLAKETAHQLGTPISSLMGWLDILNEKYHFQEYSSDNSEAASESPELENIYSIYKEMQGDVQRLNDITARFGEIGSLPKRELLDVPEIIHQAVVYFQKRLPYRRKHIEIIESYQSVPKVEANEILLQWVIENLIRNSLDAIDKDNGRIYIRTEFDPKSKDVLIVYRDNGKGIPKKNRSKVFIPGYTSKKHGWGLGLPIVKRIVEGYHGGRVKIADSSSEGVKIVITLPAYDDKTAVLSDANV